jgi:hypothetical protein
MGLADGFEELDTVLAGHVVIRDHTLMLVVGKPIESFVRTRGRFDLEALVFAFDEGSSHLR